MARLVSLCGENPRYLHTYSGETREFLARFPLKIVLEQDTEIE